MVDNGWTIAFPTRLDECQWAEGNSRRLTSEAVVGIPLDEKRTLDCLITYRLDGGLENCFFLQRVSADNVRIKFFHVTDEVQNERVSLKLSLRNLTRSDELP
jgi:hypothetical protein